MTMIQTGGGRSRGGGSPARPSPPAPLALAPLAFLALCKLALHLAAIHQYGYFRDELYYLACADRLAWGYVDHPPLSIAILAGWRALFGDTLLALRAPAALAGAATVVCTGLMARSLGGGRFAQTLAALAIVVSPLYLGTNHVFSMNAFDLLFWTLASWQLARLARGARPWGWLLLGLCVGLGLLNKLSVAWLVAGLGAATLLTPLRRHLRTPWPWAGAVLAAALFAPHVAWQAQNGWPTVEFMRNAAAHKMAPVPLAGFWTQQVLTMNPVSAIVWVAGLFYCLFSRSRPRLHALAVVFVVVVLILLIGARSRASYLSVAYPMLLAAGAVGLGKALATGFRRQLGAALAATMAWSGLVLAPFGLPILPVDGFVAYAQTLRVRPGTEERKAVADLPQHYADMFGWEEMAAKVAAAYRALPPGEQRQCGIFAQNYGEAGAIDFFGRRYGLPRATSGHNSYWLWGPGERSGEVLIILGGAPEDHAQVYRSVERVDTVRCFRCMPYERDLGVFVCRGLKVPLDAVWPRVRSFN